MIALNRIALAIVAVATLQPSTPADVAARMTGRWTLNAALSDQGSGPGGRRGGGAQFALSSAPAQRGGRGGGGGSEPGAVMPDITEAEAAAQRALVTVQEFPPEMTIQATATQVTFKDPRGDSLFEVDGKAKAIAVPGGTIKVKTRWDRATLRQEFSSSMRIVQRTWSLDADGRLLLKQRVEGIGMKVRESQAVYDRQ